MDDQLGALNWGKYPGGDRYGNYPGNDERIRDYLFAKYQRRPTPTPTPNFTVPFVVEPLDIKKGICAWGVIATIVGIIGVVALKGGLETSYQPSIIWGGVFLGASACCFISLAGLAIQDCKKNRPQSRVIVAPDTTGPIYGDPEEVA